MATAGPQLASVTPIRRQPGPERLRILLVLEAAGGGAGRHVMDLATGLLRLNHNVCLVYAPGRADDSFQTGLSELKDLVALRLPMRREVGWHDARHTLDLRRLVRALGPFDILHAHSSKAGALARLAALRTGLPCIYTPHAFITLDPDMPALKRFAYGRVERLLAGLGDQIICVSDEEAAHARRLGIPAHRLTVVHNGIGPLAPASREQVRAELGLAPESVCIGTVGRVGHQKAMDRLLTAFAMGLRAHDPARLVVVGDGPELGELRQLAKSLGIQQQVIFTGQADGPRLMAGFDVFALSSRYEALPYVLLEAAARGLPMVMTHTGGAGSVVRAGVNGFVVAQQDAEALSGRLQQLVRDPALRQRMSRASLQISLEFTAERMVRETLAVYSHQLRQPAGSDA